MALPPPIPATRDASGYDAVRIWWWALRGHCHQARHGRAGERAWCVALAPAWILSAWAVIPVQWWMTRRRVTRYYLAPTGDASLAILATKLGWQIIDHVSARPGTGQGHELRALVCERLCRTADETGTTIYLHASSARLVDLYAAAFPGMIETGRALPFGRQMRRYALSATT